MLASSTLIAILAALPSAFAQGTNATTFVATRCTTRFGFTPLPTGTAGAPTWYTFITTTNIARVTYTTHDTISVTSIATTGTDLVRITTTISTTSTITPAASNIATPAAFLPLLLVNLANPTPIPRIKRHAHLSSFESGLEVTHPLKRQTCSGCSGGFIVNRNGQGSTLKRVNPHRVDCRVLTTINTTLIITEAGDPTTVIILPSTAAPASTTTLSITTTLTEIAATPTRYAACASNNVVNQITDIDGNRLVFDRVIYRPAEGFPIQNELVTNTTSGENCCIACQTTPNCAGSFYAPSLRECHIWLTQPFTPLPPSLPPFPTNQSSLSSSSNISTLLFPTAISNTTVFPTAPTSALIPLSTSSPPLLINTCPAGSLSMYLGTIRGQSDFPSGVALVFSNGPCGRFSISPLAVGGDGGGSGSGGMLRLGRY